MKIAKSHTYLFFPSFPLTAFCPLFYSVLDDNHETRDIAFNLKNTSLATLNIQHITMSIPIIQVADITHATSFYANVCTPLGIVYLTTTNAPNGARQQHFGIAGTPSETFFSLQESSKIRPSTITLTATSATQVTNFHTFALSSQAGHGTNLISQTDSGAVAKTTDLDGNLLEVRYERRLRRGSNGGGSIRSGHASRMERQNSSNSHREGTTITTASTAKEAKRVLEWQRTVARSVSESSDSESSPRARALAIRKPQAETVVSSSTLTPQRRTPPPAAPSAPSLISQALHQQQQQAQSQQIQAAIPSLMRAATAPVGAMTAVYNELTSALPQEKLESSGLSTNAIIGTIMGAAAGAAIAYAMVKSEEPEKERPQLVTHFTAPAYQQPQIMPQQHQTRSVSMGDGGMQQQPNIMGHDMGHNMLQAMRQHQPAQPLYSEPAQYYSPTGLKAPSVADSGYSGSKVSRSEALRSKADGGSQSGSRVGSLREASVLEENYSSSPKSTHSASPAHHSSRSKAEGSHVSKSSSRLSSKSEKAPRAETVVSKHSVAKSSVSTSRGSDASTVKPAKSSASKATSKAPSEAKTSHTSHSRASEKSQGIGSVHSVKSEKSKHSSSRRVPESVVGSIAGTVVPEDSVSQVGSRHSSSRRRQEVY